MLKALSRHKQLGAMKALSALAKFTGCHERFKQLIKSYGLKWSVNNDDVIIARLIKYSNGNGSKNELFKWIRTVKQKIPEFTPFVDLVTATGLRFSEAIESFSIIARGNLDEYYNAETQALEHFKFRELFIRRTKKAFMSFISRELINAIRLSDLRVTKDVIDKRIQRLGLKLCFSDLRELWASYSVKNLRQPEIDFLQGRVSASVFMRNYFNPTWITDLKRRAIKNASELLALSR
jgi:intergrase/recombinase